MQRLSGSYDSALARIASYSLWLEVLALFLIILIGVYFRLQDLSDWRRLEQRAFYNNEPLHTTFDAWFYLNIAQDLILDTYGDFDQWRGVPDYPKRPALPPMMSAMAALLAKITPFSLSWIGAILPALLGPLLAIPLYIIARFFCGAFPAAVAALLSMLYPFYIHRSNIGRFDTDCMILTWTLLSVYLFLQFGVQSSLRRYIYLCAAFMVYALFLWWWDQAPAVVTAITLLPFLVALVFFYRPKRKEAYWFYGLLFTGLLLLVIVNGPGFITNTVSALWLKFRYISKDTAGVFPNIGITISEQSRPSFEMITAYSTGITVPKNTDFFERCIYSLPLLFSLSGMILLIWHRFRHCLFLVSVIALSVASFFANRFLLFLMPVLALGCGYALSLLIRLLNKHRPLNIAVCLVITGLFIWPLCLANTDRVQWPKETGPIVAGMDIAKQKTPPESVIWAWWDHGYALTYYARRATVNDGSIHSGERTVYTAIPYTTSSFRLSANFMQFYVIRGMSGIGKFYRSLDNDRAAGLKLIKDILEAGPDGARGIITQADIKPAGKIQTVDDWLEFFFPREKRPVYLFNDRLLTRIAHWWHWFGTWDIEKSDGVHPFFKIVYNIRSQGNRLIGTNGVSVDKQTGQVSIGRQRAVLSGLTIRKRNRIEEKDFDRQGLRFEMFEPARYGALMDEQIAESVFNKLFIRHAASAPYFKLIHNRVPYFQIWEVTGDSLPE